MVFEDGRNKGGWDICISNIGNCKISSLVAPPFTPKGRKTKYNFDFGGVSLRQDLVSQLGKGSYLISWPAWAISIPAGAVMGCFLLILSGCTKDR